MRGSKRALPAMIVGLALAAGLVLPATAEAKKKTAARSDLDTETQAFGSPQSKRALVLVLLSHAHEHLGQSIAYARSVGVVPPWNAPKEAGSGQP